MTHRLLALAVAVVISGCGRGEPVAVPAAPPPAPAAAFTADAEASPGNDAFEPRVGQEGKDVVWVPTSPELVEAMLDLAEVTRDDFVMDLGSGDGRNIIAAARRGARALGVEYNPDMVALSQRNAREAGVADRAQFVQGDMYEADISKATVLALFLLPHNLERLKDKILALQPGTRMVVNTYTLQGWDAAASTTITDCTSWCEALLHIVPARVQGTWRLDGATLALAQEYEAITGSLTRAGGEPVEVRGRVRAADIELSIGGRTYRGRVDGNSMTGTVADGSGATQSWRATR